MTKVFNFTEHVYHVIYNFLLLAHFQQACYVYILSRASTSSLLCEQGSLVPKALFSCKFRPDHV